MKIVEIVAEGYRKELIYLLTNFLKSNIQILFHNIQANTEKFLNFSQVIFS